MLCRTISSVRVLSCTLARVYQTHCYCDSWPFSLDLFTDTVCKCGWAVQDGRSCPAPSWNALELFCCRSRATFPAVTSLVSCADVCLHRHNAVSLQLAMIPTCFSEQPWAAVCLVLRDLFFAQAFLAHRDLLSHSRL